MADTSPTKPKTRKPARKVQATPAPADNKTEAKVKFSKALEEAKAGVSAIGKEAQDRAHAYREQLGDKSKDWQDEAKAYGEQARVKASELAVQGKNKASDALASLGDVVSDTASTIDEKLGEKYGDYARSAARQMQETAARIDSKSVEEMGEDAKEFVRKNPGLAVGLAAIAGFMLSRIIRGKR